MCWTPSSATLLNRYCPSDRLICPIALEAQNSQAGGRLLSEELDTKDTLSKSTADDLITRDKETECRMVWVVAASA